MERLMVLIGLTEWMDVVRPMLSDFVFGEAAKQAAEDKQKKSDDDTDGDGEEEAAPRGFPRVDLARVQHRIFAIAAAEYVDQ
jgi:hypothetical protein